MMPDGDEEDSDDDYEISQSLNDSAVLDEDSSYEPGEEEIKEYAQYLGMDVVKDADLLWIAREGLKAPLPAPWKSCKTKDNPPKMYYFNFETGESSWEYPCDKQYKELFQSELQKKHQVQAGKREARSNTKGKEETLLADPAQKEGQESKDLKKEVRSEILPLAKGQVLATKEQVSMQKDQMSAEKETSVNKVKKESPRVAIKLPSLEEEEALMQQLSGVEEGHKKELAALTAEVARLREQLKQSETKLSQTSSELAASRKQATELKEQMANAEAEANVKVADAQRARDAALNELAQRKAETEKDSKKAEDAEAEAKLRAYDREWNTRLASVTDLVKQIKDCLDNNVSLAQELQAKTPPDH